MSDFREICRKADRAVSYVAAILTGSILLAMSVLVTVLVFARYVLNAPIFWGEEMARFLMFYLVLIGSAVALRHNQHPRLTMLQDALPDRLRVALNYILEVAVIGTLLVLLFQGLSLAREEAIMRSPSLRISYFWVYLAYPLGAVLALLQLIGRHVNNEPPPFHSSESEVSP